MITCHAGAGDVPIETKIILSSHNFQETPPAEELHKRASSMRAAGADIVKIATMANDISDAAAVLSLLQKKTGQLSVYLLLIRSPTVALMGAVNRRL